MRARHHFPMTFSDICITHPQQRSGCTSLLLLSQQHEESYSPKISIYSSAAASAGNGRRILRPLPNHRALENGKKPRHERTNVCNQKSSRPCIQSKSWQSCGWCYLQALGKTGECGKDGDPRCFRLSHSDVPKGRKTVQNSEGFTAMPVCLLEGYAATTVPCRVPTLC